MAARKITNNTILLFVGTDASNLDTVVCLTNIKTDFKVSEVDASSFCGQDKTPGDAAGSISADGQHWLDPETGKISGHGLFNYMINKTTLFYRIGAAVPVDGDILQEGECFISSLGDTYGYNAQSTFSVQLSVKGTPTETEFKAVTGISILPATVTLAAAATQQITPTFTPIDATNQDIIYTTSAPSKATVSATGLITAVASGSATITATTEDGGFTDTVVVTIS